MLMKSVPHINRQPPPMQFDIRRNFVLERSLLIVSGEFICAQDRQCTKIFYAHHCSGIYHRLRCSVFFRHAYT